MNKKIIVGLIIFLVVVLVAIIGTFAFTKIVNSPKKVFAKNLKTAMTEVSEFKPKPLNDIYTASQNDIIETEVETNIVEIEDEDSFAGESSFFNSTITLDMDDVREPEEDNGNNEEDRRDEERNYENDEENGDNEERLEDSENDEGNDNNDNDSNTDNRQETNDFLDSYTWNEDGYISSNDNPVEYNINFKLVSTIDNKNKNENISIDAKINNEPYIIGNINYKKNVLGLFVEGLNERYIAIENNKLKKVAENMGMDEDMIEYVPDSLEIMNSNVEEYKDFSNKTIQYVNSVLNEFDDNQYSTTKFSDTLGVYFTETYEGKVSTLKAPLKVLKKKVYEYEKDVLSDSDTLYSIKNSLSKDTLNEAIEEIEDEIRDIESISDSEIGEVSIYITNNNIVKISFTTENKDTDNFYAIVDRANNKIEVNIGNKTNYDTDNKEIDSPGLNTNIYFELNDSNMIIKTTSAYDENDLKTMVDEYNSSRSYDYDEEENNYNFEESDDDEYSSKYTLKDIKERYPNTENTITVTYKQNDDGLYSGTIKLEDKENGKKTDTYEAIKSIKYNIKKSDGKAIVDVNDENGIIINDFQEDDYQSLMVESYANIEKYAQDNPMSWASTVKAFMSLFNNSIDISDELSTEIDGGADFESIDDQNEDDNNYDDSEEESEEENSDEGENEYEE